MQINNFTFRSVGNFSSVGWGRFEMDGPDGAVHSDVASLADRLTREAEQLIGEKRLDVETIKAACRAVIRYSNAGKRFSRSVAGKLLAADKGLGGYYLSPPYIIYHLPSDRGEVGQFHTDTIYNCGNMLTIWTAINVRQLGYAALTLLEKSNSRLATFLFLVSRRLKRSLLFSDVFVFLKRKIELVPDRKSSYIWDSNLVHKGNLNTESKAHLAITFNLSEKPKYYEPTATLNELQKFDGVVTSEPSIQDVIDQISIAQDFVDAAPNLNSFNAQWGEWIAKVVAGRKFLDTRLVRHLAFALTLMAQRTSDKRLASSLDLTSYLLSRENLVGVERVMRGLTLDDRRQLLDFLKSLGRDFSYQELVLFETLGIAPHDESQAVQPPQQIYGWL